MLYHYQQYQTILAPRAINKEYWHRSPLAQYCIVDTSSRCLHFVRVSGTRVDPNRNLDTDKQKEIHEFDRC